MRRIYDQMRMKEVSHMVNFIKYKTPSWVSGQGNRHESSEVECKISYTFIHYIFIQYK
jgi:hypothetical protein